MAAAAELTPPDPKRKRERPSTLQGTTTRVATPLGTAYITLNHTEDGEPFEVFLNVGRGGSDVNAMSEAIGRLLSLLLRVPSTQTPKQRLVEATLQLSGIGGRREKRIGPHELVRSVPDAVAHVLGSSVGMLFTPPNEEELKKDTM